MTPAEVRKAITAVVGAVIAAVILWVPDFAGTGEKILLTLDLILAPIFVYAIPNDLGDPDTELIDGEVYQRELEWDKV